MVTLYVHNESILSRADVTVISKSCLAKHLYGPESNLLSLIGKLSARLTFDMRTHVFGQGFIATVVEMACHKSTVYSSKYPRLK